MEITPLAIDHASNRVRGIWMETRMKGVGPEPEGFYTWLMRMAREALMANDATASHKFRYLGMKFQIFNAETHPMLHDVERIK